MSILLHLLPQPTLVLRIACVNLRASDVDCIVCDRTGREQRIVRQSSGHMGVRVNDFSLQQPAQHYFFKPSKSKYMIRLFVIKYTDSNIMCSRPANSINTNRQIYQTCSLLNGSWITAQQPALYITSIFFFFSNYINGSDQLICVFIAFIHSFGYTSQTPGSQGSATPSIKSM